jgi:hypothetical protein
MSEDVGNQMSREAELVGFYSELTGANESTARGVFMYVCYQECETENLLNEDKAAHLLSKEIASQDVERNFLNAAGSLKKIAVNPT